MIVLIVLGFILGAAMGSFLGVLIDRLPRNESIMFAHSRCEHCSKHLGPLDLIPVFSYLMLGGKCRYCHAKIPPRLLYIETATGLLFALFIFYALSLSFTLVQGIFLLAILFCLFGILISDFLSGLIPNILIYFMIGSTFLFLGFTNPTQLLPNLITGLISLTLFYLLYFFTGGRGMGFGDVKFALAIGFFLGFPNIIVALYFAFLTATAVSLILIVVGKKKLRGDTIVFGPFLSAGTVFAFLFGQQIMSMIFK